MLPRLRADVEKAKKALKEYEGIRSVLGGTTDAERAQLKAELAEAEKWPKAELDDPTPREAPERAAREEPRAQSATSQPSSERWAREHGTGSGDRRAHPRVPVETAHHLATAALPRSPGALDERTGQDARPR